MRSGVATVPELVRTDLLNSRPRIWPWGRPLALGAGPFYLAYLYLAII